jgi:membrane protein YdbS with pleckstrin-like domain
MGYPRKLLSQNEIVKVDLKPHWLYFFGPAATLVVLIVLAIVLVASFDAAWLGWFSVIVLVVGACWLVGRFVRWRSTYFVITNDKVIYRQGVLRKSGVQIPLERVNSVNFEQNLVERVVGAGDLIIESGGMAGPASFSDVRHPDKVQIVLHDAIEENASGITASAGEMPYRPAPQVATPSTPLPPPPPDVASQLERLEGLLQRGSITREEFDTQKQRLLGE